MSNYLAVATVTETLRRVLATAIGPVVGAATVTTGRPGAAQAGATPAPRVNVFLYQVTPNPTWRNADLPTRSDRGQLLQRPRAAVDLHYLITCTGEDATQDAHQLLGLVVRTLHSQPALTRDVIEAAIAGATNRWLDRSDLYREGELVRFTPVPLSLDDLSRLWTVFPDVQYELSLVYVASVVFIEQDEPLPIAVLPVLDRTVTVLTGRTPAITQVAPGEGAGWQIVPGSVLTISGRHLLAPTPADTRVLIDDQDVAQTAQEAARIGLQLSDAQITLRLAASVPVPAPGLTLAVGPHRLHVAQPVAMGRPKKPHEGFESNTVAFLLQPQIRLADPAPPTARVTFSLDPPLATGQVATLTLISVDDSSTAEFPILEPAVPGTPPPPAPANPIAIDVPGLATGAHLVRATVDGVVTPLTRDTVAGSPTFGLWSGPRVALP